METVSGTRLFARQLEVTGQLKWPARHVSSSTPRFPLT
jgi:hypothetical protein